MLARIWAAQVAARSRTMEWPHGDVPDVCSIPAGASGSLGVRLPGHVAYDLVVHLKGPVRIRIERSAGRVLRGQIVRRDQDRSAEPRTHREACH